MALPEEHIPEQQTGSQSDTESVQEFAKEAAAKDFYEVVKKRLLQVGRWHEWAGAGTATFWLTDGAGNEVNRDPLTGDHFKIDIPGPGPKTGDGYDWVRIESVQEMREPQMEALTIRVRPATNPQNQRQDVAHFFSEEATSNFVVQRHGTLVSAEVHGRNEKPNTAAETLVDKARNATVATGAISAFSKLQWKALVNGLVSNEEKQ
jgi:hypothetical protein